jgi:hypothetical protein
MNLRHAAALALVVSWYLMVPPAIPGIGEVNLSAPLRQWNRLLLADNQGCEAAKASLHQQALAAETERDALSQRVRNPELHGILCNAQCVAQDDPASRKSRMKFRHAATLACGVLVTTVMVLAPAVSSKEILSPPAGWRLLRPDETAQSWRSHSPSRYLSVTGNFTGDGNIETAIILVRDDGSGFAPFVALTGPDHKRRRFLQGEETNPISYLRDEGIKLLKSGKYVTTCGRGYGCTKGEKESVTISTDAVEFFKYEGPARMIFWDKNKGALSEV